MLTDALVKELLKKSELATFFEVTTPDATEFELWHDMDGESIDCNIYHPKYGYEGHMADSYRFVSTSYNPTAYQDPKTGRWIWCKDHLPLLCQHEDGTFTNKDGQQVVKKTLVWSNQKRLATNSSVDFKEIFERESIKKGVPPTDILSRELTDHVQKMLQVYKDGVSYANRDIHLVSLAEGFIEFLNTPLAYASRRINTEAQRKHARIYKEYDGYISKGHTHGAALDKLVHDMRFEYNKNDPALRKKTIQKILRDRNNKE